MFFATIDTEQLPMPPKSAAELESTLPSASYGKTYKWVMEIVEDEEIGKFMLHTLKDIIQCRTRHCFC
jgi:hypothetical protein